jgi:hypothetical protein
LLWSASIPSDHLLLMLTLPVPFGATGARIEDQSEWNPK